MQWFVHRWQVEVTFEKVRAHLGVETQRQWSDKAIARTTPLLLALFSLVTLFAHPLIGSQAMPVRCSTWYQKIHPSFSDALALVRRQFWVVEISKTSRSQIDIEKSPDPIIARLIELLCYAA